MKKLLIGALLIILSTQVNAQSFTVINNAHCTYSVSAFGHLLGQPYETLQTHWFGLLPHTSMFAPSMSWFNTTIGWFGAPVSGFNRWDCARVAIGWNIRVVGANPLHPTVYSTIPGCSPAGNVLWQYDTAGNITLTIND
jgi:hypothetical protein